MELNQKTLVVAEKPSVGRDIARVLGCREKGEGYLFGEKYIITWAIGHLVALSEPDEIDEKYKKWRMDDLPILPNTIPLKVLPKTKSQFRIIKNLMNDKSVNGVICATDAGREGELIFRFIYDMAKCKKPVLRLWISSLTDEAVREGFEALKPGADYDLLYQSALCRAQADWLVGMNASRAFTLANNALLSIGRVQTPTLAILTKRQLEINNFKPEEYFVLVADFGDYQGTWFKAGEKNDTRIQKREDAEQILNEIKNKRGTVIRSEAVAKQEIAPQLYDLTSLQREANRALGFTAQRTLKTAQSLYEKYKAITYPRTDSRYLSTDMVPMVYKSMAALPEAYQDFVQGAKKGEKLSFTKRIYDNAKVTDHHAIIPTAKKQEMQKLPPDEGKLYDMIAKRFIAAFYPPYLYDALQIITQVEGHTFRSIGRKVKDLGWRAVYESPENKGVEGKANTKKAKATEGEGLLPAVKTGDERDVKDITIKQETTKPPPLHTDGTLLSAMEKSGREIEDEALREQMKGSGLGTPATRAAIIERLITVGYALRKGKAISATEKGMALIQIAPDEITSPETTGKWELGLHKILSGEQDPQGFLTAIQKLCVFLVNHAKNQKSDVVFPKDERKKPGAKRQAKSKAIAPASELNGLICPLCSKGNITENSKAFACSRWREGCHFTIWKNALEKSGGPGITPKIIELLIKNNKVAGSTGTIELKNNSLLFYKKEAAAPEVSLSIDYQKGRK